MRNPKNPDDPDDCYWSPYWGLVPPPPHMGGRFHQLFLQRIRIMPRGRKSADALSTSVVSIVPGERPPPPEELTDEQAETWRSITGRMPADWFQVESWPLLTQLCRHVSISRLIGTALAEIDPETVKDDKGFRRLERLRCMHEKEGRAINALMRTMRITHQAKYNQTRAHVAARSVPSGPRPWETS